MYIYQMELLNGKSIKIEAAKHKDQIEDENLFVLYGQDDEIIGKYRNVDSWSRKKLKTPTIFAL